MSLKKIVKRAGLILTGGAITLGVLGFLKGYDTYTITYGREIDKVTRTMGVLNYKEKYNLALVDITCGNIIATNDEKLFKKSPEISPYEKRGGSPFGLVKGTIREMEYYTVKDKKEEVIKKEWEIVDITNL